LLARLRDATVDLVAAARSKVRFEIAKDKSYEPVSEARGNIAQFMSELEAALAKKDREIAELNLNQARVREAHAVEVERVRVDLRNVSRQRDEYQRSYYANTSAVRLDAASVGQLLTKLAEKLSAKGIV
jgi:hypothetical protein